MKQVKKLPYFPDGQKTLRQFERTYELFRWNFWTYSLFMTLSISHPLTHPLVACQAIGPYQLTTLLLMLAWPHKRVAAVNIYVSNKPVVTPGATHLAPAPTYLLPPSLVFSLVRFPFSAWYIAYCPSPTSFALLIPCKNSLWVFREHL